MFLIVFLEVKMCFKMLNIKVRTSYIVHIFIALTCKMLLLRKKKKRKTKKNKQTNKTTKIYEQKTKQKNGL